MIQLPFCFDVIDEEGYVLPGPTTVETVIREASRSHCNRLRYWCDVLRERKWISHPEYQRLRMLIAARRWQREALAV
jgi:hypothetical protein